MWELAKRCKSCGRYGPWHIQHMICAYCGADDLEDCEAGKSVFVGVWYKPWTWFDYKFILRSEYYAKDET